MKISIIAFLVLFISGQALAQEENPAGFYEWPVSASQQSDIDNETDRFGPLEDPLPSTLSSKSPQVSLSIVLPRTSEAEESALVQDEPDRVGPLQIGFGRAVPADYRGDLAARLEWFSGGETDAEDGPLNAALTVTSPEATALRIGLRAKLAAGAAVRFTSLSDPEQQFRSFTHEEFGSSRHVVWSPVIEGDTVRVDIGLPSPEALLTLSLFLDRVSHIVAPVGRSDSHSPLDADEHGCPYVDVHCHERKDVNAAASATALVVFTRAGHTFQCTGVLLNDRDKESFIPYFLTAHHCIASGAVARTVTTYWDFESTYCDGPGPAMVIQRSGGADLLEADAETDHTLLRLKESPPTPRTYSGSVATPIHHAFGAPVYGVHHPGGTLKKWSAGKIESYAGFTLADHDEQRVEKAVMVSLAQGATQRGSSGSGLFDADGRLRGVLSGVPPDELPTSRSDRSSSLSSNRQCGAAVGYGRYDQFFPLVREYLLREMPSPSSDDDKKATDGPRSENGAES